MTENQIARAAKRANNRAIEKILSIVVIVLFLANIGLLVSSAIVSISISREAAEIRNMVAEANAGHKIIQEKVDRAIADTNAKIEALEKEAEAVDRGGMNRSLPDVDTSKKTYMDYRCIKSSLQYELQRNAATDKMGFRRYGEDYMVAMASYYGVVGDRFLVTLESGVSFTVVKGDAKSDKDVDALHMHRNGNVIEFIVDSDILDDEVKRAGDVSGLGFEGQIKSITALV